jgi:hypothetical protein
VPPALSLSTSRRAVTLALALTAVLGLSACAGQTTSSSSSAKLTGSAKPIGDQLTSLSNAADDDKAAGICSTLLTPALAAKFAAAAGGNCAKAVQYAIDRSDYSPLDVKKVVITGDTAVATILHADGVQLDTIDFQRVTATHSTGTSPTTPTSSWRISSFPARSAGTTPTPSS